MSSHSKKFRLKDAVLTPEQQELAKHVKNSFAMTFFIALLGALLVVAIQTYLLT